MTTTAEQITGQRIEAAFARNPAFRKLDEGAYIVKQGSTFVMLTVLPLEGDRAQVRCIAQLVKGVNMTPELALELLRLNTRLRFGAFAYAEGKRLVLLTHSLLGGQTLDPEEIAAALADLATVADEQDDHIIAHWGGQRMQDLLEASEIGRLFAQNTSAF
jgi:hypothetical protein